MERVDASFPWSDPSSLDPQIEVVAPDGYLYQNLVRFNDAPGVDFNATITNAVLPSTGIYVVLAETARGAGAYRLTFSFGAVAPASPEDRVIPVAGNWVTAPVSSMLTSWAALLDPRGHPISGANLTFASTAAPGDAGALQFLSAPQTVSAPNGTASVQTRLTGFGRVRFAPTFDEPFALPPADAGDEPLPASRVSTQSARPLYSPVAVRPFTVGRFDGESLWLDAPSFERLPLASFPGRTTETPGSGRARSSLSSYVEGSTSVAPQPYGPEQEARVSLPVGRVRAGTLQPTSCQDGLGFQAFAVDPAAQVLGPLTVSLEDLTPRSGESSPNGPVGDDGIWGHRVEKEIRLRVTVRDASGAEPLYPVLVSMAVGGRAAGMLILDPDGARLECPVATFVWHERDASGTIIARQRRRRLPARDPGRIPGP